VADVAAASTHTGDGTSLIGSLRGRLATVKAAWRASPSPGLDGLFDSGTEFIPFLSGNCCLCQPIVYLDSVFLRFGIRRGRERTLGVWV